MNEKILDRHGQNPNGKVKDKRFLKEAVIVDLLAEGVSAKTGMNNQQMAQAIGISGSTFSLVMHGRGGERPRKDKEGLSSTAFIARGLMDLLTK